MKYKVRDKVRVRKDLEIGKCYGGVYFRKDMLSLLGYSLTVSSVNPNSGKMTSPICCGKHIETATCLLGLSQFDPWNMGRRPRKRFDRVLN